MACSGCLVSITELQALCGVIVRTKVAQYLTNMHPLNNQLEV